MQRGVIPVTRKAGSGAAKEKRMDFENSEKPADVDSEEAVTTEDCVAKRAIDLASYRLSQAGTV